jgi:hypothetical protein
MTTATGSCLCGAVRVSLDTDQVISAHHCHCTDCQKATGSGRATIIMLPTASLQVEGPMKEFTVTGTDGSHITRTFCPECGSPLVSYSDQLDGIRFIKAGALDDSSWVQVSSSFWADSARPWSPVDAACQAFPRNPTL